MFWLKGNSCIDPNSVFSSLSSDLRREPSGDRNRSVISDHCFCTDWWVGEIPGSWCEDFFPSWFLSEEEYSERTFNTLEILIVFVRFYGMPEKNAWSQRPWTLPHVRISPKVHVPKIDTYFKEVGRFEKRVQLKVHKEILFICVYTYQSLTIFIFRNYSSVRRFFLV